MAQNRFAVSAWPLRRKLALALAIPMLLAAVFGALRVQTELEQAANYTASASQVTVLPPAVAYLSAAEQTAVMSRTKGVSPEELEAAIAGVNDAAVELEKARDSADLTADQREAVDTLLQLSNQLRNEDAYVSLGQSTSQVRQLHRGVTLLIGTIANAQLDPNPELELLDHTLDGRLSLSMQQLQVAYGAATAANPVELSSEVGVEAAAIDRLGVALGPTTPLVLQLKQQNALHFGSVKSALDTTMEAALTGEPGQGIALDLGGVEAYAPYDELTADLFTSVEDDLASAASEARTLAIVNSVVTGLALLAAIILALLVSRWLLNPIRRVREGALRVANEQLPAAVQAIRAGGAPPAIETIDVTTTEEMGQLARAVDDLHRQAVHLASGEAALRSQVGEMFVTLSRRNTTLINQQLGLIETLERDEEDPKRLESLFRLDHLASRMRRTAESLMVLADTPVTAAPDTLTVADALHAATAGVADYQRVQILSTPGDRILPIAAGDVVHMVTELLDNALAYSPPTAPVLVMTTTTITATTIRINDAGLGIDHDAMSELNNVLRSGGEVTAETARRMGLLVVSRLAKRHGISVALERNERGGTTATVVLPRNLLRRGDEADVVEPRKPVPSVASSATPYKTPVAGEPEVAPPPAEQELDTIEAAINAVIGLPQRRPGATGAGALAATDAEGRELPQRTPASEDRPGAARTTSDSPGAKSFFLGARKEPLAALGAAEATSDDAGDGAAWFDPLAPSASAQEPADIGQRDVEEHDVEEHGADEHGADEHALEEHQGAQIFALPSRSPFERPSRSYDEDEHDRDDEMAESAPAVTDTRPGTEADVQPEPAAEHQEAAEPVAQHVEPARLPDRPTLVGSPLDASTPVEHDGIELETPIFRSLRSNWLSAGEGDAPWVDSEVEAGWEAADRVAETPPLQRNESGLPMRRPGGRLVPGGVSPAATAVVRDPEAIRARLSAHRAGVARGRTAATDDNDTSSANDTDSHDVHDAPQKEAGLV